MVKNWYHGIKKSGPNYLKKSEAWRQIYLEFSKNQGVTTNPAAIEDFVETLEKGSEDCAFKYEAIEH